MRRNQTAGVSWWWAVGDEDWLVLGGIVLLAAALWMWFGLAAVLAFIGTVLVIMGLIVALRGERVARRK